MGSINDISKNGASTGVVNYFVRVSEKVLLREYGNNLLTNFANIWLSSTAFIILIIALAQSIYISLLLLRLYNVSLVTFILVYTFSFLIIYTVYINLAIFFLSKESSINILLQRLQYSETSNPINSSETKFSNEIEYGLSNKKNKAKKSIGVGVTILIGIISLPSSSFTKFLNSPKKNPSFNYSGFSEKNIINDFVRSSFDRRIDSILAEIDSLEILLAENHEFRLAANNSNSYKYLNIKSQRFNKVRNLNEILKERAVFITKQFFKPNETKQLFLQMMYEIICTTGFSILFLLGILRHKSVDQYFSISLQLLFSQYQSGKFNSWLDPEDRSSNIKKMSPVQFEMLVLNYPDVMLENNIKSLYLKRLESLQSQSDTLKTKVNELHNELNNLVLSKSALDGQIEKLRKHIFSRKTEIEKIKTSINSRNTSHHKDLLVSGSKILEEINLNLENLKMIITDRDRLETNISKKKIELEGYSSFKHIIDTKILDTQNIIYKKLIA